MSEEPLLCVRGLTKTYGEGDAAATVLRGVDLDLECGEMAALLGPSGSGKSTLLTILGTLLRPTGGLHRMLGEDLTGASDHERTRFRNIHIGFVFQFHHLLPDLTTGNLDRESADQVMALLDRINCDTGTCFLISTHDEHIAAHCRRHIELLDGQLVRGKGEIGKD